MVPGAELEPARPCGKKGVRSFFRHRKRGAEGTGGATRDLSSYPRLGREEDLLAQKSIRITTRLRVGLLTSANPAAAKMLRLPTWSSPQVISLPGSMSIR